MIEEMNSYHFQSISPKVNVTVPVRIDLGSPIFDTAQSYLPVYVITANGASVLDHTGMHVDI